ncbi:MAG: mitochondrial fission ELM1 family protein [Pseudomonadota bacterium]
MNEKASSRVADAPDSAAEALRITVVTDGRAGNAAQALGLAEALGRRGAVRIEERVVQPRGGAAMLPAQGWHMLGALPGWPAMAVREAGRLLTPLAPSRLVIGAGRRAAPIVAHLAARDRVQSVQLLSPQMSLEAFSLVAAPAHDGLDAPNTISTLGSLGRLSPGAIAAAGGALPARTRAAIEALPQPRVGVLLGGPSGSARWSGADADRFLDSSAALASEAHGLVVTASRRTDPRLAERLRAALPARALWLWDGTGANPYPGLLSLVDAVLVTADSVNMASEAAASGLPVHVFGISALGAKLQAFHAALEVQGAARSFRGKIEQWRYAPLLEADRVAGIVAERLLRGWPA